MPGPFTVGASVLLQVSFDYSKVRFDAVDILYVSPFCVQEDKTFNFEVSSKSADPHGDREKLAKKFHEVIELARNGPHRNPNIQVVLMQMWSGDSDISHLKTDHDIEVYTNSAVKFIVDHRIDGYDNDYESGNVVEQVGKVLSAIRQKLDNVRKQPPYHVSIAPAKIKYLDSQLVKSAINYVSMQNYSGGLFPGDVDQYKHVFNGSNVKIIFGINSETAGENWEDVPTAEHVVEKLHQIVTSKGLDGIYSWRLDSGDWIFENALQVHLYRKFKGVDLKCDYTIEQVEKTWPDVDGSPIPPFA